MTDMLLDIPVDDIHSDDDFNCRGPISGQSVFELAQDIKVNGLIQPIVVQPWNQGGKKWRIVCGHRRFLAIKTLRRSEPEKFSTIQGIVRENLSEQAALILNIKENVSRENLNIKQEALALKRFQQWGWDEARVARELGQHTEWVRVRYDLLSLPDEIQARAEAGWLTQHQIRDIAAMTSVEMQMEACRKCVDHKLRGEKGSYKLKTDPKRVLRKGDLRGKEEIFEMQEFIQDTLGENSNFGARCLAWAAGVISDEDLFGDIEKLARERGRPFSRPQVA
jgi:ParB family chromosome partitioning protein